MNFPFGPSVTWLQRSVTSTDADGNDVWTATATTISNAAFSPGPSIETVQGQDMIVNKPTLYLPPSCTPPGAYDRFVIDGVSYDVSGVPAQWKSPFTGWAPGILVQLQAVTG